LFSAHSPNGNAYVTELCPSVICDVRVVTKWVRSRAKVTIDGL